MQPALRLRFLNNNKSLPTMGKNNIPPLEKGAILYGKHMYKIKRVLGKGVSGITYLAESQVYDGDTPMFTPYIIKEYCPAELCTRRDNGDIEMNGALADDFLRGMEAFKEKALKSCKKESGDNGEKEVVEARQTVYFITERPTKQD